MASNPAATQTGQAFGNTGYRSYVLFTLTLAYTLNFIDRILIGILSEPIIEEFGLSDLQFGMLSGLGFAFMYTLMGIPIARLSEKYNRVRIIAVGIVLWSIMTAACGFAGGFLSLLIFRVGVGVGEACLAPPANSIIADYYPPRSRAKALSIYATGITLGTVLAAAFGGPIAEAFTWREAFIILGIPGVLVGVLVWFSVKEPPRGYSDPPGTEKLEARAFGETVQRLRKNKSYLFNIVAATTVAFVGYSFAAFQASFFQRAYDMSLGDVATQFLIPLGLTATAGSFLGGYLTEKLSTKSQTTVAWLPGVGLIICVPFYWFGVSSSSPTTAFAMLMIGAIFHYLYLGAQFTICQAVVGARSRPTAIALMLFVVNMIGYGFGPPVTGFLSDIYASSYLEASAFGSELTVAICKGGAEAVAKLGADQAQICGKMASEGLRGALRMIALFYGVAGVFYLVTAKCLPRDLVSKM